MSGTEEKGDGVMRVYEFASTTGKFTVEFNDKTVRIIGAAATEVVEMEYKEATRLRKIIASEVTPWLRKKGRAFGKHKGQTFGEIKDRIYHVLKEAERPLRWSEIRDRGGINLRQLSPEMTRSIKEELNIEDYYYINPVLRKELKLPYKSCWSLWWLKEKEDEFRRKFKAIDEVCKKNV